MFIQLSLQSQQIARKPSEKISPFLALQLKTEKPKSISLYTVAVDDLKQFLTFLSENKSVRVVIIYEPAQLVVIECNWTEIEKLLQKSFVTAVDSKKKAKEELLFGFVDYAANKISTIQNRFPLLNGSTISISVKEQKFDTSDIDFKGRIIPSPFASAATASHASIMATMIAGGGNAWYNTKGAAWSSNLSSASFDNLLPEPNSYYQTGILVQNHSYGTIVENFYGVEATGYDASAQNNNSLLHIFSVGNSGTLTSTTGQYSSIGGYANLTGNFKHAKNIITVGHIDSFGNVLLPSSKGPAFDGRVKPELVAFGEDGSSGAAALVSGVASVLHQTYKEKNNGSLAPSSLIKAVLLNSADDVDATGIDFKSGYGSMNAFKAVKTMVAGSYFQGSVTNNTQQQFLITLPSGIKQLKLTLVWTDVQAIPNTPKAVVNDLDLELRNIATNTVWQPWVLNSTANISALQQLPVRKRDSLNVVEQITVDNPLAGNYEFTVKGFAIPVGAQNFSIAYQVDTVNTFNWYFPTSTDHLFPAQTNIIRFESGYSTTTGQLEMSIDNGTSWQLISNTVDLTKGYYKLVTPDLVSKAMLRMKINSEIFVTDTFTISKRITTAVGFNCADSFMISWPRVTAASGYQISRLGNRYMETILTTTDTFAIFAKNTNTAKHNTITPLLGTKTALRTYTFNYETAGTGCYVQSFFVTADLLNNGILSLELGTIYQVQSIRYEKQLANGFVEIGSQKIINNVQFQYTDKNLINGSNIYRVVLELTGGRKIYSPIAILYYTGKNTIAVYPNPLQRNGILTVLAEEETDQYFELINSIGIVVLKKLVTDYPQQFALQNLPKGIYFYRFLKQGIKIQSGVLIIQ